MNERNVSRRVSTGVVDTLKDHGHILVVKGGATALARELDEILAPSLSVIDSHIRQAESGSGEENPEPLSAPVVDVVLGKLTRALMSSDHVEDIFAEDSIIRREIWRAIRNGLLTSAIDVPDELTAVTVKLDALGYVAATASKRADVATLRQALDRAASVAHARFAGFMPQEREAMFRIEITGSDARLGLEEAVADELTDLVEQGVVDLPTVERRLDLGRAVSSTEQRALAPRIEVAAETTLLRSGCATSWDFVDAHTLRVIFTPLSDQDALGVDSPTSAFAREIGTLFGLGHAAALVEREPHARPRFPKESEVVPTVSTDVSEETRVAPARRTPKRAATQAAESKGRRATEVEKPPAPKEASSRETASASKRSAKTTKALTKKR